MSDASEPVSEIPAEPINPPVDPAPQSLPEWITRRLTAWTVFHYERQMYEATWFLLNAPLAKIYPGSVNNAIVESHSLHIQNLCKFLLRYPDYHDYTHLDINDLVDAIPEEEYDALESVWNGQQFTDGSAAHVLSVMSDCTVHRRSSYDYGEIAAAIHGPLEVLMDKLGEIRQAEILACEHAWDEDSQICVKCGGRAIDSFKVV